MKNSYYFPHDYHARHDPKLERLRMDMGPLGDGIYWNLVEMLYEEGGYLRIKDIPLIALSMRTTIELLTKVVTESELFEVNKDVFYSESLLERLNHINLKRRKARASIKRRWNTNVLRTNNEGNTIKESKVKDIKVKKDTPQPDFLTTLKTNPVYSHINIDIELAKMDIWLSIHKGRQKTKRFIVNWLNKIEKPLEIKKPIKQQFYHAPDNKEQFKFKPDVKPLLKELSDKMGVK